jgi:adenine-specific DNA-methyltransferase
MVFFDGFSGTGVVAHHFKSLSNKVIANDLLYSNYLVNKTFLATTPANTSLPRLTALLHELNSLEPQEGYIYHNFAGTYFTPENAGKIDASRERIEHYAANHQCTEQEKHILLTSLLFAVDKVANTVGQYDAYLKHIGQHSYDSCGTHKVDSNVYKKLKLALPRLDFKGNHQVYNRDLNDLIKEISADVLYLDPPYNTRQYVDNYHLLENIARWEKPVLYGKTCKFERTHLKSAYSSKVKALPAFTELIKHARAHHIFLSYNNEGIIPAGAIMDVLSRRGQVKVFETSYAVFGNGAGRSQKRPVMERLYYCRVKGSC